MTYDMIYVQVIGSVCSVTYLKVSLVDVNNSHQITLTGSYILERIMKIVSVYNYIFDREQFLTLEIHDQS